MSCESIKFGLNNFVNTGLRPLPRAPRERHKHGKGPSEAVLIQATLLGSPFVVRETPSGIVATINGFVVNRGAPADEVKALANLTPPLTGSETIPRRSLP